MIMDRDPLADRLTRLPSPDLDAAFTERVRTRCLAELSPHGRRAHFPVRLRLAFATGLVPALLISAAAVRIVQTVQVVARIF
jgi:hypothetical protein